MLLRIFKSQTMESSQCLAWWIRDTHMDSFVNGPKYHLPYRCVEPAIKGDTVCAKCFLKREKPRQRNGFYPAKWWGLVTEPVQNIGEQINHMAFSPWFYEKAKQYSLSEESMKKAKRLFEVATQNVTVAEAPKPLDAAPETKPAVVEKKKPGRKKKDATPAETKPESVAEKPAPAPAIEKKKPVLKKKAPKIATEEKPPEPIAFISNEKPIEPEDVEYIQVKPFQHDGTLYYLDSRKQKLYDRQKDGSCKGVYKGRWDSVMEKVVTTIPDSDAEN